MPTEGTNEPTRESTMVLAGMEQNLADQLDERLLDSRPDHLNVNLAKNWTKRAELALQMLGVEVDQLEGFEKVAKKLVEYEQIDADHAKEDVRMARQFVAAQPGLVLAMLALAVVSRRLAAHTLDSVVDAGLTTREDFQEAVEALLEKNPPFGKIGE